MSYLQLYITRTDVNGIETSLLDDIERVTVKKGLDQKANTVDIVLKNPYISYNRHKWVSTSGELVWEEDDGITIKAKYNVDGTALSDDDILTIADALEFNGKLEDKRTTLSIKAVDKTFNLLNRSWASSYTVTTNLTVPEVIQNVIQNVTESEDGDATFQIDATLQTELTYDLQKNSATPGIQTRRIDDSLFPVAVIAKVWKPVYEWIDDLSTIEFTNNFSGGDDEESPTQNRKMRYYVDRNNVFRWFYPDDDIDYTIVIGTVTTEEDDVKSYDLTKGTFDVINFVIYNGGLDMYGVGTLNYYFDLTTKSKKLLTKYKAYNDISVRLIQKEIDGGNLVLNTSGTFTFQGNRYNRNGTITPHWLSTTVATDDDYNDSLRVKIDNECKARARNFTAQRGSPRWRGSLVIRGRNYAPGETILLTSYVHGIKEKTIRINNLTHNITKDSWDTTLSLEEDDPKVGV